MRFSGKIAPVCHDEETGQSFGITMIGMLKLPRRPSPNHAHAGSHYSQSEQMINQMSKQAR